MNKYLLSEDVRYRRLLSFAQIGWWEANLTKRQYSFSEELAEWLGLEDNFISFEHFRCLVREDYRDYICDCIDILGEVDNFVHQFPILSSRHGEMWVKLKLDTAEVGEQGELLADGYLQIVNKKEDNHRIRHQGALANTSDVEVCGGEHFRNAKLLSEIYNRLPVGVELYDKNGILVDINDRDIEIFGVESREKVLGVNLFENPNLPKEVVASLKSGKDINFRIKYSFSLLKTYSLTSSSGYKEIAVKTTVLRDAENQIQNYLFIVIDNSENELVLTKVRDFENVFKLISEYAKVGYAKLDPVTKTGYASDQWFRNYGEYNTMDIAQVIGIYSKMHSDDRKRVQEFYKEAIAGNQTAFKSEVRILQPDGSWKWILTHIVVSLYKPEDNEIEFIGVNYDISELKEIETELMCAKDKAETMDRLKSAFLANMSHEIRTPLNAIVGFSRLMNDESLSEYERTQYMGIVEENNGLLLQLISDILDLSKIEAGTFEFVYGDIDVNQFFEDIVQGMEIKAPQGVELIFEKSVPDCHLFSDKYRLYQVMSNFINNAFKFTFTGSVRVGYIVKENELEFYVRDTGHGIPSDKLPTVFERFVKLNHLAQGTGLGLAICKSIVEQFGGRIGVESDEGVGSHFWFTYPWQATEFVREHNASRFLNTPLLEREGRKPIILVAEDTDSNYLLLSAVLKKEYELYRAKDGLEAVEMCRDLHPDLVLMDIRMPRLDGLEATKLIREYEPTVPILALTAFAFDQDRQKAIDAGCNAFITKPVSTIELKTTMNEWLFK